MTSLYVLGIDIGGSGIKGGIVDVARGTLVEGRFRLPTPAPALPHAVGSVVAQIVRQFQWAGPVGCAFPAVVKRGIAYSAANVDRSWIGINAQVLIEQATGCPVVMLNDADAAGLAEVTFGAARGHSGVVLMLTLGTGIGSALIVNGRLVPNTELGHLYIRGKEAELWASDRARKRQRLSWKAWAVRVNTVLDRLDALFAPDLFILGGGVSKRHSHFLHMLRLRSRIVPAQLLNNAGIVGAALAAGEGVRG